MGNEVKMNFKNMVLGFVCVMLVGCATSQKYTVDGELIKNEPVATVELQMKEIAIGIGGIKGSGTVFYRGGEHGFTMKGIDYGSFSKITLDTTGDVYHMEDLSEFEGVYFQAKAGATIGRSGKTGIFLVNRKGVTMHLTSEKEKGFDLSLGRGGIKIKLDK